MAKFINADKLIEQIRGSNLPYRGLLHRILLQAEEEPVVPVKGLRVFLADKATTIEVSFIVDNKDGTFSVIPSKPLEVIHEDNRKGFFHRK